MLNKDRWRISFKTSTGMSSGSRAFLCSDWTALFRSYLSKWIIGPKFPDSLIGRVGTKYWRLWPRHLAPRIKLVNGSLDGLLHVSSSSSRRCRFLRKQRVVLTMTGIGTLRALTILTANGQTGDQELRLFAPIMFTQYQYDATLRSS